MNLRNRDFMEIKTNSQDPQYVNVVEQRPIKKEISIPQAVQPLNPLNEGLKFDDNKLPLELLPTQALEEIAKVLAHGREKYAAWNWAKGFRWSRLIGAALRHLYAWARGEDKDPESGISHLAHLGCCVVFLLQHEISGLGEDDRFKGFNKNNPVAKTEEL